MNFRKITPDTFQAFRPFFKNQKYRLCTYSLPVITVWTTEQIYAFGAIRDDALVVYADFETEKQSRHLILPICPSREYPPESLYELAVELGFNQYWFVPDQYINNYGRNRIESLFKISEQTEYADYIYRARDLIELQGNRYAKKRNLIHQFEKNYMGDGRVRAESITSESVPECEAFLEKWCEERACDVGDDFNLACEKAAAVNALNHLGALEMPGLLLRIDGNVSAFAIGSTLTADMGALHFEKAFAGIKGLYQYFDRLCAERLFSGLPFINKESDMNLPGLRRAKRSYHPVMMVKSNRLELR
jgi:hypothetical protein